MKAEISMEKTDIPDIPKIRIPCYWNSLSDKLSIILQDDLIKPLLTPSLLSELSFSLEMKRETLLRYSYRKKYPLPFLKILQKKFPHQCIESIIEKGKPFYFSKWKRTVLPLYVTPKLAYYVGYLYGDGSIESNGKRINFADEYLAQIERINNLTIELFGIKGTITTNLSQFSTKPCYRLEVGSLAINSYLNIVFGLNKGYKENLKVPSVILSDKTLLTWFLIGIYDADGTLPKHPSSAKQLFVDLTIKDNRFIETVKLILLDRGIPSLKIHCRMKKSPSSDFISKTWEIRIRRRNDIITFLKEVGFSHPDKKRRAEEILALYAPVAQLG